MRGKRPIDQNSKQYKDEMMIPIHTDRTIARAAILAFYRNQLEKFYDLGIGKETEFGVTVTKKLIKVTQKRYDQLRGLKSKISLLK